jgi:hypothetical protein
MTDEDLKQMLEAAESSCYFDKGAYDFLERLEAAMHGFRGIKQGSDSLRPLCLRSPHRLFGVSQPTMVTAHNCFHAVAYFWLAAVEWPIAGPW